MKSSQIFPLALTFLLSLTSALVTQAQQPRLDLKPGDRICIIGNTLAERMQHDGWLESALHARYPDHQLTIRNLGYSADEITTRLRSKDFGTPDQWLTKCQADVVFAFFGYNESHAEGPEGLAKFEEDLEQWIQHVSKQEYNGQSAPRLVLFTPIAQEDLVDLAATRQQSKQSAPEDGSVLPGVDAHVTTAAGNNARLQLYAQRMMDVAARNRVQCVDLFSMTRAVWAGSKDRQNTINGIHLNSIGNKAVALLISGDLFGELPDIRSGEFAAIREAVLDKNWHWFHRYRTTDGYSTYGGRADLKFTDGQTNREVVQRELEVLDWMTAERDKKIWAAAQGKDFVVDDSKSPPFIPVITNKPGPLPGGKHEFLSGVDAIEKMEVHEGMSVNLFASEEMFPELASPVQMSFDTKGRMWVAVWPTYPHWQPKVEEMNDKLLIFIDSDNDGVADEMKVFADQLHNPTGFEFWNGGVLVAQAPDLWYLKDTDSDDVADVRMRILHGIDSADTHHTANSFTIGPGGALYFQEGTFHHSQMETPWSGAVRCVNAGVFRFEPRTFKLDVYVSYPFANPHGHVFDYWGQDFVTDGTGNVNYFAAPFSGHVDYPAKHRNYFPFFQQWVRPAGGTEFLSSEHFPDEFQGNYLIANVIGFQGLLHYEVREDGSGFGADEVKPIVRSSDPNFRPVDLEIGPDGAIYFVDWQNPIIGHMQHNLRDPNRDKEHGRVYRVTYNDRPLQQTTDLTQLGIRELLDQLKSPISRIRYRTRIELSARDSQEVVKEVIRWTAALEEEDPAFEHHLLEGLWIMQHHQMVEDVLLKRVLSSSEPRARAAAVRVLCYVRDQFPNEVLDFLRVAATDEHPRVRLEAVRACSFFRSADAAEIALSALNYPTDKFLDYCLQETVQTLQKYWKPAVVSGEPFAADNEAGLNYVLSKLDASELAQVQRTPTLYRELLTREGILHDLRMEAAQGLAKLNHTDPNSELLAAIKRLDQSNQSNAMSVLADLTHIFLMHGEHGGGAGHGHGHGEPSFAKYQPQLEDLAKNAQRPVTRQIAYATLMKAEKSSERVWNEAIASPSQFRDFVSAVPLIDDPELKAELHPKVFSLLDNLPMKLEEMVDSKPSTTGRFVRIELPGDRRTLTLAEVEVFSDGRNIGPTGKAKQSGTRYGGKAQRGIDGNTDGVYSAGGQTHTPENKANPWWELDLGGEHPIESITIWNRTDGDLGKRLEGFTIKLLDHRRDVVFESKGIPAPEVKESIPLKGDPRGAIQRAAIMAAVHTGGGDQATFERLTEFVLKDENRAEAIRGLSRLPRRAWVEGRIESLVNSIIQRVSGLSAKQRTETVALDELSLGKNLVTALPREKAERLRKSLNDLGINVIVLRPIPHRMQYDRSQFFVEAGKPFQIVFENTDIMPHNIVITAPGAYAKVGIAGEEMATQPDGVLKHFVPDLPEVLHASKMLQPGQVERLNITAPSKPGEYPYVCTFPGHWRRMYGTMHVVEDLNAVPVETLVPTTDPTVATRPFVREWSMDDLQNDIATAHSNRSFDNGKKLFVELSCAQCHKFGDSEGGEVGPDLVDLQKKFADGEMNRLDLLRELVEPSFKIDDQYKTLIVQDLDGRIHTGVIGEETDEHITLLANPLDKEEPVTIAIEDIDDEKVSKISMMPIGLVNTLTKDEILDLLIYVEASGDPDHKVYKDH